MIIRFPDGAILEEASSNQGKLDYIKKQIEEKPDNVANHILLLEESIFQAQGLLGSIKELFQTDKNQLLKYLEEVFREE